MTLADTWRKVAMACLLLLALVGCASPIPDKSEAPYDINPALLQPTGVQLDPLILKAFKAHDSVRIVVSLKDNSNESGFQEKRAWYNAKLEEMRGILPEEEITKISAHTGSFTATVTQDGLLFLLNNQDIASISIEGELPTIGAGQ